MALKISKCYQVTAWMKLILPNRNWSSIKYHVEWIILKPLINLHLSCQRKIEIQ